MDQSIRENTDGKSQALYQQIFFCYSYRIGPDSDILGLIMVGFCHFIEWISEKDKGNYFKPGNLCGQLGKTAKAC